MCNGISLQAVLKHSLYYPFVKDWLEVFGREAMLVTRSEDFYGNITAATNKVLSFLDLG